MSTKFDFDLEGVKVHIWQQRNTLWAYERHRSSTNEFLSTSHNYPTREAAIVGAKRGVGEM